MRESRSRSIPVNCTNSVKSTQQARNHLRSQLQAKIEAFQRYNHWSQDIHNSSLHLERDIDDLDAKIRKALEQARELHAEIEKRFLL